MTHGREQLWAYLATLSALVLVFIAALLAALANPEIIGKVEAFGLGAITGGLIGILRMPARGPSGNPGDPVAVEGDAP